MKKVSLSFLLKGQYPYVTYSPEAAYAIGQLNRSQLKYFSWKGESNADAISYESSKDSAGGYGHS